MYEFLYNADLMRQTMYSVSNGSGAGTLQSWVQRFIDAIETSTVPQTIATEIAVGQDEQVQDLPVQYPNQFLSAGQLIGQAAAWGGGRGDRGRSAVASGGRRRRGPFAPIHRGGACRSGPRSRATSSGEAGVPEYTNLTVPVAPITNNMLDASKLHDPGHEHHRRHVRAVDTTS